MGQGCGRVLPPPLTRRQHRCGGAPPAAEPEALLPKAGAAMASAPDEAHATKPPAVECADVSLGLLGSVEAQQPGERDEKAPEAAQADTPATVASSPTIVFAEGQLPGDGEPFREAAEETEPQQQPAPSPVESVGPAAGRPPPPPVALKEVAPAFVRGYSGSEDDDHSLGNLVASVLPGWVAVDRFSIVVEEVSGEGAQYTHKVSAQKAVPPVVALHRWDKDGPDEICQQRTAAAAKLFAQHGLAPARLAEGGDWYIEPWEGSGQPELDASRMAEVAELVARVHRLPTEWYDGFRKRLQERTPELRQVPMGSHVWWWSSRGELMDELTEECRRVWCETNFFAPDSEAGKRIVTIHADLHAGNMLETDDGLLLIDFEYACVTHAVHDLAFAMYMCCDNDIERKEAFIEAYLKAMGYPADESDVEALLFDAEVAFLGTHCGPLELWIGHGDPQKWLELVHGLRPFILEARARPDLRRRLLEQGVTEYLKENRSFCSIGMPIVLCDLPEKSNGRLVLNEDGTISPEALRSTLAIGIGSAGTVGSLVLVARGDARLRVVFCARPLLQMGAEATAAHAAGAPFVLAAADRPEGLFLAMAPGQPPRSVRGAAVMQPLALGPLQTAVPFVRQGAYFVRYQPQGPQVGGLRSMWSAIYIGDVDKDIARAQAAEMYEFAESGDADGLRALLSRGVDVNLPQEHDSLGHIACRNGHTSVLQVLLSFGFNPNAGASYGGSPLIEAATYGKVECAKLLLAYPDVDLAVQEDDKTALEWAREPDPHDKFSPSHAEIAAMIEAVAKARVCPLFCGAVSAPRAGIVAPRQ